MNESSLIDRLINVNDAARLTGLDKNYLYALAESGRLPSIKLAGTARLFDRHVVESWDFERRARKLARRAKSAGAVTPIGERARREAGTR